MVTYQFANRFVRSQFADKSTRELDDVWNLLQITVMNSARVSYQTALQCMSECMLLQHMEIIPSRISTRIWRIPAHASPVAINTARDRKGPGKHHKFIY